MLTFDENCKDECFKSKNICRDTIGIIATAAVEY